MIKQSANNDYTQTENKMKSEKSILLKVKNDAEPTTYQQINFKKNDNEFKFVTGQKKKFPNIEPAPNVLVKTSV